MNIDEISDLTNSIDQPQKQNYVSLFYDGPQQRLRFLADYLQVGLACGEMCILVTAQTPAEVEADLISAGLNPKQHLKHGALRIFNAREAYLTNSLFVVEYMHANIVNLMSDAKTQGYSGIRTVGELRDTDATNRPVEGLCIYPVNAASVDAIRNTASQHINARDSWANNLPGLDQPVELSNTAVKKLLLSAGKG